MFKECLVFDVSLKNIMYCGKYFIPSLVNPEYRPNMRVQACRVGGGVNFQNLASDLHSS